MYPKLEWWESKTPWYSRESKNRDKGITGFNHEQISSDKNPTENIVETAVSTDNEIEKIVLENHELNSTAITHKWFAENSYQQELIRYAYSIGWLDFVKLIECENGQWNPDRKVFDRVWYAYWLCQMNDRYHKIPEEYWKDGKWNWYYQIDYCFAKWKSWTKFYGISRKIKWQTCANYVSDRFTIIE